MELSKEKYIYDLNDNTLFITENSNNIISIDAQSEIKEDFYYLSHSSNILEIFLIVTLLMYSLPPRTS